MPEQRQVYVGHRYVPKVMGEWSSLISYEGLSIVLNEGNSYTSKKMVPIGIPLSNDEYWVVTGNYNAQIENYRNEVEKNSSDLISYKNEITKEMEKHSSSFINVLSLGLNNKSNASIDNATLLQNYLLTTTDEKINLYFPKGDYLFEKTVLFNLTKNITIKGERNQSNLIADTSKLAIFKFYDSAVDIEGINFVTNSNLRTEFTIYSENVSRLWIAHCSFSNSGGQESGIRIVDTVISSIDKCVFNHANISIKSWDVKITDTWIWALWRPYGIGIHGGSGNITIMNVDIVPPFRTVEGVKNGTIVPNIKAGIWINSENGNPTNSINMSGIYLDGNAGLDTGIGLLMENAFGVVVDNFRSNLMNSDVIVIDTCFNVVISKGMFVSNNKYDQQGKEILVRKTFDGKIGNIDLNNNHFLNYLPTGITVPTPAIKIDASANGTTEIETNTFGQSTTGRAYGSKEIELIDLPSRGLHTNNGTLRLYKSRNTVTLLSGETGKTVAFSQSTQLAYQPNHYNIRVVPNGNSIPPHRIQITDGNNVYISFDTPLTKDLSFYLIVEL